MLDVLVVELREIERAKIDCASKFFKRISSSEVTYAAVDSYAKLIDMVMA